MSETVSGTLSDAQPPVSGELPLERIACPLCGSSESQPVLHAVDNLCGIPGQFTVERCQKCHHLFMNPRPTLDHLGDCYPAHYGPHQSAPEGAGTPSSAAETADPAANNRATDSPAVNRVSRPWYLRYLPLKLIPGLRSLYYWLLDDRSQPVPETNIRAMPADQNRAHSNQRSEHQHGDGGPQLNELTAQSAELDLPPLALELGCATGRYLERLQQKGWRVVGVEPGERPARMAQQAGLDVHCGTLDTCQLSKNSFDLAAAWMVIEHVPDPRSTLTGLHELLKPQGHLLISIPNAGCWEPMVFGRFWYVWELPRHLHHFTPASIHRLLTECGYSAIHITHQRTMLNVIGSLGMVVLSRWPGSRIGKALKYYPDHPSLAGQLVIAPMAHLLAWLGQGGRLTVSAKKE